MMPQAIATMYCDEEDSDGDRVGIKDKVSFAAYLAKKADRHDDVYKVMLHLARQTHQLNPSQHNMLTISFENAVAIRQESCKTITKMEKEQEPGSSKQLKAVEYRKEIEAEIREISESLIDCLDKILIPNETNAMQKILYHKLRGDHHRYLAEIAEGEPRSELAAASLASFKQALELASDIDALHPAKLAVVLNCTSLYYDILEQSKEPAAMIQEVMAKVDETKNLNKPIEPAAEKIITLLASSLQPVLE